MEEQLEFDIEAQPLGVDVQPDSADYRVVRYVQEKFYRAETARLQTEQRWLDAARNYRGVYSPDMQFTDTEKCRVFLKVTKTKVQAAYGQIGEVLFGSTKFPITVDPTTLPENVEESVHIEMQPTPMPEKETLKPGETFPQFQKRLGALEDHLEPVKKDLKEGQGRTQSDITFYPALETAKKMEKKILDQLEESKARKQLRTAAFECVLFGTGVMKGPFAENKEYPNWDETGNYTPVIKTLPKTSCVSVWDFYPDPDAKSMDEAEFTIERHKMSRSQVRGLKKRPLFRPESIDKAIEYGPNYQKKYWEFGLEDSDTGGHIDRFEVLEFWGFVDVEDIEDWDIEIPEELEGEEQASVNIWVCNDEVLRVVFNPFKPAYLPYYAVPYEVNPYDFFGIGVAENMSDTQTLMNGFMRMAVDNAVLSGSLIFDVDEDNLSPDQDLSIYPGKVFKRAGGAPGQSIVGIKFPNTSNENMMMFDKARVLADESTGFPSFAHGQTGVTGVGRTASGISMLMSAAAGSIKTVVKNIDDYLLGPLGTAFFRFNMQFDFDPDLRGDLEVRARGTESLMANEVRSQRLMQFLAITNNPIDAAFANRNYLLGEVAKSMDLDPEKAVYSLSEAGRQAKIIQNLGLQQPQQGQGQQGWSTASE